MADPKPRTDSFAAMYEQSSAARTGHRRYHTGEALEVTIVAVAREAVFADLGGKQEGLFERAELTDADGTLRVSVGSRVAAMVSGIDAETGQVRLVAVVVRRDVEDAPAGPVSLPDAGGSAGSALVEGARVKGKVTGIERYGVFVQLPSSSGRGARGLVPTAETGTPRGSDLKKHFAIGQDVEAKILAVDETGRIRLSFSALKGDDERGLYEAYQRTQGETGAAAPKPGAPAPKPAPRNFGTLGDLLGKAARPAGPSGPKPKAAGEGAARGAKPAAARPPVESAPGGAKSAATKSRRA